MRLKNWVRTFQYGGALLDYYRFTSLLPHAIIRAYESSDFDRCSQIYEANEVGRFPNGYLRYFQDYLRENRSRILVVEKNGIIVGTGGISLTRYTDELRMAALSFGLIDPAHHKKGFGTLLFCARIACLRSSRHHYVTMMSAGNGTERFYRKLGFQFVAKESDQDGNFMQYYRVKVLDCDISRFRTLIANSDCEVRIDFGEDLIEDDQRAEVKKIL